MLSDGPDPRREFDFVDSLPSYVLNFGWTVYPQGGQHTVFCFQSSYYDKYYGFPFAHRNVAGDTCTGVSSRGYNLPAFAMNWFMIFVLLYVPINLGRSGLFVIL